MLRMSVALSNAVDVARAAHTCGQHSRGPEESDVIEPFTLMETMELGQ